MGCNVSQEIVVPSGLMELSPSLFLELLDFYFDNTNWEMEFKSNKGRSFSEEEAINMMVSLNATDANSDKKWRGFFNSLSQTELKDEWDEYWKFWLIINLMLHLLTIISKTFILSCIVRFMIQTYFVFKLGWNFFFSPIPKLSEDSRWNHNLFRIMNKEHT